MNDFQSLTVGKENIYPIKPMIDSTEGYILQKPGTLTGQPVGFCG